MQVVLVMIRSNGQTRSFSLSKEVTILGRRNDCDLRIPLPEVSRRHARIIKQGNELLAEDLGSANGTTVNDQRIQQQRLNPGDRLQLGSVEFIIQIDGTPADETPTDAASSPAEIESGIQDTDQTPSTDPDPFSLDDSLPPKA